MILLFSLIRACGLSDNWKKLEVLLGSDLRFEKQICREVLLSPAEVAKQIQVIPFL